MPRAIGTGLRGVRRTWRAHRRLVGNTVPAFSSTDIMRVSPSAGAASLATLARTTPPRRAMGTRPAVVAPGRPGRHRPAEDKAMEDTARRGRAGLLATAAAFTQDAATDDILLVDAGRSRRGVVRLARNLSRGTTSPRVDSRARHVCCASHSVNLAILASRAL